MVLLGSRRCCRVLGEAFRTRAVVELVGDGGGVFSDTLTSEGLADYITHCIIYTIAHQRCKGTI